MTAVDMDLVEDRRPRSSAFEDRVACLRARAAVYEWNVNIVGAGPMVLLTRSGRSLTQPLDEAEKFMLNAGKSPEMRTRDPTTLPAEQDCTCGPGHTHGGCPGCRRYRRVFCGVCARTGNWKLARAGGVSTRGQALALVREATEQLAAALEFFDATD